MSKKVKSSLTTSDKLIGIFLFIVVAIIPLVCKFNSIGVSGDEYNFIRSGTNVDDVFSYSKSVLIMTMGVIIALFMLFQILGEDGFTIDFKSKPVILAGVYILFALVSAVFSKYHYTAFFGISERYEGFFVWICYMVFMVVAMAFSSDRKRLDFILWGFFISGVLVGAVGLAQFMGYNIFSTEWCSKLVLGSAYEGTPLSVKFDSVFATLYNPNCAGMYFAMMFSAFAVMAVLMPVKKIIVKVVFVVLAVVLGICAMGTDSVGGFIGIGAGVAFTAITALCYYIFVCKKKEYIYISIGTVIAAIAAIVIIFNSNAVIIQKFNVITDALKSGGLFSESPSFYEDIEVDGMVGKIITKDGEFAVDFAREASQFMHNGNVLEPIGEEPIEEGGTKYIYNESGLTWEMCLYEVEEKDMFIANIIGTDSGGTQTYFLFGETDGKLAALDKFGNAIDLSMPTESFGFKGYERLGSNRGYIWSRSIPLLKHNIFIGSGPDTFVFEFPQDDIKGKLNYLGNPYVIIDKPHNMFLQTGINTGVVSLVVMIVLFVLYVVQTIRRVFADKEQGINAIRLGIMAGVIAYMAAGMTTDSVVSVAPVFWTLIGTGFGANVINHQKDKKIVLK